MGIPIRALGHGLDVSQLKFVDGITAPASSPDPIIYRVADVIYFRDADGIVHPLVVGADGAGVVTVAAAASPYAVQATDRILLVDTTAGAVTITLPSAGGPFAARPLLVLDAKRQFGTNACTISGNSNNINGAATLVLNSTDAGAQLFWATPTWRALVQGSAAALVTFAAVNAALAAANADINVNGQKITGMASGADPGDAVAFRQTQVTALTLVAGTKTVNTGITILASSKVFLQMRTPGGGGNGVQYKVTGLTVGAPGTGAFTVTAVDTAGALVNTDVSVLDAFIFN